MIPSGKSMEEVEAFVRRLVKDKLEDGQLIESAMTIKDVEVVIQSFTRVFRAMYHDRIPYPSTDAPPAPAPPLARKKRVK
jgi:membrane-associated HD superfamily phosphohydrolase